MTLTDVHKDLLANLGRYRFDHAADEYTDTAGIPLPVGVQDGLDFLVGDGFVNNPSRDRSKTVVELSRTPKGDQAVGVTA